MYYLVGRLFATGPEDLGSISNTLKMALDTSLLNTQQYKSKVEQSRERGNALPYTSVLLLLKKELSGHPRLRSPTYLYVLRGFGHK